MIATLDRAVTPSARAGRPIRVLDLRDTYEIGGPGKTILETYRAIDTARFDLHVGVFLGPHETDRSPFVQAARAIGMPLHFIRGAHSYDPRMVGSIVELVGRLGIDILHPHEVISDVLTYAASFRRRVPIVTTMHGWIGNNFKQRCFTAIDKLIARRYDRVIAVSRKIQDELLAAGVPASRLRLVHNAIVLDRYRKTGSSAFLQEIVGRPLETPVLVSIGRMSPEKGHADLIEAVRLLAASGRRFSVVLVGDGSHRAALEARVWEYGLADRVHFPGYLSDPARVLENADLKVLPSHTEGLPNAALEALAMEVPVLATRVGGTPEVITDGETGRLVPPHSPEALAAGIAEFLDDREGWRRMAVRGRAMVERQFDFRARTRHIEAIYTELVEGMTTREVER